MSGKVFEAQEHCKAAEKALKTTVFRWKPDYDSAADEYTYAAQCYRIARDLPNSKECHLKASECYKKNNSFFHAAKALENAMIVSKEIAPPDEIYHLAVDSANLYQQHGSGDSGASVLDKGAKIIEGTSPELSVRLFQQAADVSSAAIRMMETEDIDSVLSEEYSDSEDSDDTEASDESEGPYDTEAPDDTEAEEDNEAARATGASEITGAAIDTDDSDEMTVAEVIVQGDEAESSSMMMPAISMEEPSAAMSAGASIAFVSESANPSDVSANPVVASVDESADLSDESSTDSSCEPDPIDVLADRARMKALTLMRDYQRILRMENRVRKHYTTALRNYSRLIRRKTMEIRRYDQAVDSLRREIGFHQESGNTGAIGRLTVAIVLVQLARGDAVAAEKAYKEWGSNCEVAEMQTLEQILQAYDEEDRESAKRALSSPFIRNMDVEYARLAATVPLPEAMEPAPRAAVRENAAPSYVSPNAQTTTTADISNVDVEESTYSPVTYEKKNDEEDGLC